MKYTHRVRRNTSIHEIYTYRAQTQGAEASMRTQDGSGGSGGRMEKPIARAVTFFVSRIQIKHKKIHLALGHTWHSVILGTRSTWHSVILGTRSTWHSVTLGTQSTWHSVTWHSVHLALGPLGTRSTWHSVTWHSVPTSSTMLST